MDLCVFNLSIFDCCIYISLQSQYPIYFIMLDFSVFLAPMHACSKALSSFLLLLYTLRQISLSLCTSLLCILEYYTIDPFTTTACNISGLKAAGTCLQTVYFLVLEYYTINPFTTTACNISGLKAAGTCLQTVYFFGPITHLLSVLCVLTKVLSHSNTKKKTKRLRGFKFRTFIGRFQATSWQ